MAHFVLHAHILLSSLPSANSGTILQLLTLCSGGSPTVVADDGSMQMRPDNVDANSRSAQ